MNRDKYEVLGKRLREFRKSIGLSQRDFADRIDISNTYLSEIETGKANPAFDFFVKLIEIYNINLDYLFKGIGKMTCAHFRNTQDQPVTKEIIHAGGPITQEQLNWLIEYCPGFYYSVFGFAVEYIYKNKGMILDIIEKINKEQLTEKG